MDSRLTNWKIRYDRVKVEINKSLKEKKYGKNKLRL